MNKLIYSLKEKKKFEKPPIWIMRQAGRYLPEYREIRSNVKNFLELCYNPKLSSEVTLQPIERFNFDAAIIFSDILVIPDALGIKVDFIKGIGPKLKKVTFETDLKKLARIDIKNHLNPVFESLKLVKSKLKDDKSLIGFSGSPWTLACYMIEGGGSKNFEVIKRFSIENEKFFTQLIEILTQNVIEYLSLQIKSGANVVKLFDSWAGILPPVELKKWVINPNKEIVAAIKKLHPEVPIICFPRAIGVMYKEFVESVNPDGIAIDQTLNRKWVKDNLQNLDVTVQGNLDNFLLAFGSKEDIKREVLSIVEDLNDKSFIFNLGHGILPQTPIENVNLVVDLVKKNLI